MCVEVLSRWKCESRWNIAKTETDRLSPSGQRGEKKAFKNTDKAQAVNKLNKRRWIAPQARAIKGSTHCQWGKRSQEERKQEWIRVHSSNEETIICHYTHLYQKPRRADHMDPQRICMRVGGWYACVFRNICMWGCICSFGYKCLILARGQCPNAEPRREVFIHLALAAGDGGLGNAKTCSSLTDHSMEHRAPFSTISFTHFLMGKNVTGAHFSLPDILDC